MKKTNTFWNWFQDNNQKIRNIFNETPKNQKEILFWLGKNLSYYCKEIGFMIIFPKNTPEKAEFIITANGNPNYFKQVTHLIDNAPRLRTWKFTAFIQPTEQINQIIEELEKPYIFPENTLKARKLQFLALDHNTETQKFEIQIYLKNYNLLCDTKTLDQAIFIVKQDLREEKSLFQNIHFVQLAQLPDNKENLIHLYDLQFYIDVINNSCK